MDFLPLDIENHALDSNCEVAVLVFKDHGTYYLKHFILCPNVGAFLSIRNPKGRKALEFLERKKLSLPILASLLGDSQCASRFEIPDFTSTDKLPTFLLESCRALADFTTGVPKTGPRQPSTIPTMSHLSHLSRSPQPVLSYST